MSQIPMAERERESERERLTKRERKRGCVQPSDGLFNEKVEGDVLELEASTFGLDRVSLPHLTPIILPLSYQRHGNPLPLTT